MSPELPSSPLPAFPKNTSLSTWLEKRWPVVLIFWLALATILRLWWISDHSIWLDEAYSVFNAQKTFPLLMEEVMLDPSPPLYYITLHGWMQIFGDSLLAVRGLSLLFSIGVMWVLFEIARRFISAEAGILVLLLHTFSNLQLHNAQEARCFMMVEFFAVLSMLAFLEFYRGGKGKWFWLLLFSNLCLIYLHYATLVFFIFQGLIALWAWRKQWAVLGKYVLGMIGVALLFLPWYLATRKHLVSGIGWLQAPDYTLMQHVFDSFFNALPWMKVWATALLAGLVYVTVKQVGFEKQLMGFWGWGMLGIAVVFSYVVSPMVYPKYILFILPGYYLLIAMMLMEIPNGWVRYALVLFLFYFYATGFKPWQPKSQDWKNATYLAWENKTPGSKVVVCASFEEAPFAYHYQLDWFRNYRHTRELLQADGIIFVSDGELLRGMRMDTVPKVIVLECQCNPKVRPSQFMESAGYHTLKTGHVEGIDFRVYTKEKP